MVTKLRNNKVAQWLGCTLLFFSTIAFSIADQIKQAVIVVESDGNRIEEYSTYGTYCDRAIGISAIIFILAILVLFFSLRICLEKKKMIPVISVFVCLLIIFATYKLRFFHYQSWDSEHIIRNLLLFSIIDVTFIEIEILFLIKIVLFIPNKIVASKREKKAIEQEKQRREIEKIRQEMLANISHDLRSPLTSIISYVELLQNEELMSPADEYVRIINQKTEGLRRMVEDVLYLSKLNSGRIEVKLEKVNIKRLLEQALFEWGDENIDFICSEEEACIYSDGGKIFRILQNIYDNAIKYAKENTRIQIRYESDGALAHIQIKNESSYEMPFEGEDMMARFVRGDKARTTEGHGLGLSITTELVALCGGTIKIDVKNPFFIVDVAFPICE